MEKPHRSLIKKVLLIFCLFLAMSFLLFVGSIAVIYNSYELDINRLTSTNNGVKVYSSSMTDTTLYNTNRSIIEIETLPDYVVKAFVDTEDKRFFSHNGYDIKRILKAGLVNLTTKSKSQGASTISQQLIKNALLTNEKTYSRKLKEIVLAVKMEKKFSKNEILEMYLNTIYFGSNAYGIENASKVYFNKSAKDLTLNETCVLVGLIKSPAKYSPKTNYNNAINRRNVVAKLLYDNGDISLEDYNDVLNCAIEVAKLNESDQAYEKEAIYEACNLLNISERELINRKYQIVTYKDDELQNQLKKSHYDEVCALNENLDSLSIVANNDGKIIAYYVNSDYNLHDMKRQPASTLKPLAVYMPCIIHNILSPSTLILDDEINYNGFSPKNADDKYHGYVSTRLALSKSYNIPAVKALDFVGVNKAKECLLDFGINISKSDLNLSLALGAVKNGVSLIQLLNAYSIISNMGVNKGLTFIDKILDEKGNIVYNSQNFSEKIFKDEDCFLLTDMLKDTAKTGSAKRLNSLNLPVACKTGTASNGKENTDLYNIAYTSEHTMLSWVSCIKNNKLPANLYSSVLPTEINKQILSNLYDDHKPADFVCPSGVSKLPFDLIEYENNHHIVAPATNLERFIANDNFKNDNPPKVNTSLKDLGLNVNLNKNGANISFYAKPDKTYYLYKITDNKELINLYQNKTGVVEYVDNNVFHFSEITYLLTDGDKEDMIAIKPKDYLINLLNNEVKTGKKKWYV